MQTTCTRKHDEPSQDSYHGAMLAAVRFNKQADKMNHGARVGHRSHKTASSSIRLMKNDSKIFKLLQFLKN